MSHVAKLERVSTERPEVAAERAGAGQLAVRSRAAAASSPATLGRTRRSLARTAARPLLKRPAVILSLLRVACFSALAALGCSSESSSTPSPALPRMSVLGTTRTTTTTLIELHTASEKLLTTPEHPFAAGNRWTRAGDLKVGDSIATARGSTRVLGVQTRRVPPTVVYNLTIAKTHSYFAGRGALLVHNVDCGPAKTSKTLAEQLAAERQAEALERDIVERRIRRLLDAQRRKNNRLTLNDKPGIGNCGYCTLTALKDEKSVSEFARKHGFDQFTPLPDQQLLNVLHDLGLRHANTPEPKNFRQLGLAVRFEKLLNQGTDRDAIDVDNVAPQRPEPGARAHMESLPGNTNMLLFRWMERVEDPPGSGQIKVRASAHAVTAVRTTSGRILYVESQAVPPRVYLNLPKTTFDVVVLPTDVDWRYNRQLYSALRDGQFVRSY